MNSDEPELHRHHHHKHHKKTWTPWKIILLVLGILVLAGGAFAAKVYYDVDQTAKTVYKAKGKTQNKRKASQTVKLNKKTPFSILLLGTDTGELGRTYKGRTDTMILATVNPKTKQTNMLSIARDSRVPIVGYGQTAKINAAYAYGGIPMAINTVQSFLNVPVDYYVLMNMKGLEQLVDAVDGVTVNNKFAFDIDQYHFDKGPLNLDGEHALYYSRMRYTDSNGDFGRQIRQQEVIRAVLKKAVSLDMVSNYSKLLQVLENNMQTNLTLKDAVNIQKNYGDAMNFKTRQLKGTGQMIDGQSFQVMSENEVSNMSALLRNQLDLK